MIRHKDEILQACEKILSAVSEKAKAEVNPLLTRIQVLIHEFQLQLAALSNGNEIEERRKQHWSILNRDGDMLAEMATLIQNTTPLFIQTEINFIQHCLVLFTNHVVKTYGKTESLYIITPKFQELSGLW